MKAIVAWTLAQWAAIPHQIQAVIVVGVSVLTETLVKMYDVASPCWTWGCFVSNWHSALHAAIVALAAFYMSPSATSLFKPSAEK